MTTFSQPTRTLALSTTFTPPSSCTLEHNVDILPSPGYLIYWNEPVPAPGVTARACYPSEFLEAYTAVGPSTARALGSSVVPAFKPLICPESWCAAYVGEGGYVACCPESYTFDTTTTALAISSRPAYGGICYSNIALSQRETARVYAPNGDSKTQIWAPSTTGAQAYAHPMDGWVGAGSTATVGCASQSSSSTKRSKSSSKNAKTTAGASGNNNGSSKKKKKNKKKVGGGAIAGAVIGAVLVLAALVWAVVALLKRRKSGKEEGDEKEGEKLYEAEAGEGAPRGEVEIDSHASEYGRPLLGGEEVYQLKGNGVVAELSSPGLAAELPTSDTGTRREVV